MNLTEEQKKILINSFIKIKNSMTTKIQAIDDIFLGLEDLEEDLNIDRVNNALLLFDEVDAKGRQDMYNKIQVIVALENFKKELIKNN